MHDIYHLNLIKPIMPFRDIRTWVQRVPFTMAAAPVVQDGPCGGISAPEAVADDPPVAIEAGADGAAAVQSVAVGKEDAAAAPEVAKVKPVASGKKAAKKGNGGNGGRGKGKAGVMKKPAGAGSAVDDASDAESAEVVQKKPSMKTNGAKKRPAAAMSSGGGDKSKAVVAHPAVPAEQAQDEQAIVGASPAVTVVQPRDIMKARTFNSLWLNRELPTEALALVDAAQADRAKGNTPPPSYRVWIHGAGHAWRVVPIFYGGWGGCMWCGCGWVVPVFENVDSTLF